MRRRIRLVMPKGVTAVVVRETHEDCARAADEFFGRPAVKNVDFVVIPDYDSQEEEADND